MVTVNMHEAKTQLSKLVERAEAGEEVIIARSGKPVAKLVAVKKDMTPRPLGTMAGKFTLPDDFDIDEPLPPDIEAAFYGVTPEELDQIFPRKKFEWPEDMPPGTFRPAKT